MRVHARPRVQRGASAFDLTGRVALVTGASRGLGAAIAQALARAGADLILWSRNLRQLSRQATRLRRLGRRVLAQAVDVTDQRRVRRGLHAALRAFGRVDILVNNAGIWGGDPAETLRRSTWDAVLETDLTGVFFVSQAVAPVMMKHRYGKIINVASTSGVLALPHGAAYGSAKAALFHLTRILAVEWGPHGIRVTGIAPGVFRTDMTREMFEDRAWVRRRRAEIPLRRFGEPEDLGGLAVFLASSASDHLTGQTIIIDGGACLTV
jgi:NAD(P)-dependent dehydrogenase (short-subunit alcohol dehydrogenase family)